MAVPGLRRVLPCLSRDALPYSMNLSKMSTQVTLRSTCISSLRVVALFNKCSAVADISLSGTRPQVPLFMWNWIKSSPSYPMARNVLVVPLGWSLQIMDDWTTKGSGGRQDVEGGGDMWGVQHCIPSGALGGPLELRPHPKWLCRSLACGAAHQP